MPPAADGVAVNVALCPTQIVVSATKTVGIEFTVTLLVAAAIHPIKV